MKKIIQKIFAHKVEALLITIILLLATYLRLWDIRDYMVFLGDQGRDVLIVRDMFIRHRPVFIGPTASVGGFFLGPFYYYLIAPALLLANFDPVGPAILVALLSIATTALVYYFGRTYFSPFAGISAAAIYAVSRLVVEYARSSWNPNVLPFFSLVLIIALAKIIESKTEKLKLWFFIIGLDLGIIIQLHYQAVAMHLVAILALSIYLWKNLYKKQAGHWKNLAMQFLILALGAFVVLAPFGLFELKHQFPNTQNIYQFVVNDRDDGFSGGRSFEFILRDTSFRLFLRLVGGGNDLAAQSAIIITIIGFLFAFYAFVTRFYEYGKTKSSKSSTFTTDFKNYFYSAMQKKQGIGYLLLVLWFICGVGVWGIYKKSIFDYYFSYMYPLPVLMFAAAAAKILNYRSRRFEIQHKGAVPILTFATLVIVIISYLSLNIREVNSIKPGQQVMRTEMVAREILARKAEGPYNFALLTPGNSDHAYRYFLAVLGNSPTSIDDQVTSQLMVFCEANNPPCQPEGNSLWEVAGFGPSSIIGQWQVIGLPLYRLAHNPEYVYLEGKPAPKGSY